MINSKLKKANALKRQINKRQQTIAGLKHLRKTSYLDAMYPGIIDTFDQLILSEERDLKLVQSKFKRL